MKLRALAVRRCFRAAAEKEKKPGRGRGGQTPACHICSISSWAVSCFSSCAAVRRGGCVARASQTTAARPTNMTAPSRKTSFNASNAASCCRKRADLTGRHAVREAQRRELVGELRHQIQFREASAAERIGKIQSVIGRAPEQHHALQRDAKAAGDRAQQHELFRRAHQPRALQAMHREVRQGREEHGERKAEKGHRPGDLIEGGGFVEQPKPGQRHRETKEIEAADQTDVDTLAQLMHDRGGRHG